MNIIPPIAITSAHKYKKIEEFRRAQPLHELKRKRDKAIGRHSNDRWCVEVIDYAIAWAKVVRRVLTDADKTD